jgi:hypothetical protein
VRSLHAKAGCGATAEGDHESRSGIQVEVLTTAVPPEAREAWYDNLRLAPNIPDRNGVGRWLERLLDLRRPHFIQVD